jgi:hypothetical protein
VRVVVRFFVVEVLFAVLPARGLTVVLLPVFGASLLLVVLAGVLVTVVFAVVLAGVLLAVREAGFVAGFAAGVDALRAGVFVAVADASIMGFVFLDGSVARTCLIAVVCSWRVIRNSWWPSRLATKYRYGTLAGCAAAARLATPGEAIGPGGSPLWM